MKYVKKQQNTVDAIQLNFDGEIRASSTNLWYKFLPGNWLVLYNNGDFDILTDEEFKTVYVEQKPTHNLQEFGKFKHGEIFYNDYPNYPPQVQRPNYPWSPPQIIS